RLRAYHDRNPGAGNCTLSHDRQREAADIGRAHRVTRKRRAPHAARHRGSVRRHNQPV
ncbi:MAG: hypothetical protein AVDCRST_MAG93-9062, partial [uncultured Chloroflexia bacterium]